MAKNVPQNVIVHHTAVSYNKNPDQFKATDNYHKSKGWGMIGYHHEIAKDGTIHKGREHTMEGAHCYQENMNYKSIGIVLDGAFDDELPTEAQVKSLKWLLGRCWELYKIPAERVYPHRHFAVKTCYGKKISNDWASNLMREAIKDLEKPKLEPTPEPKPEPAPWVDPVKAAHEGRFLIHETGYYFVQNGVATQIAPGLPVKEFAQQFGLEKKTLQVTLDKLK